MNSIDDFLEILVAVYVIVIALIVVLTQLESTLDNRSRPRPAVRRSKLASVDARAADLRHRSRLHIDR